MDHELQNKKERKERRIRRVRNKIHGTLERPRMTISRTNRHLFVQLIDDDQGKTIVSFGTLSKENQKTPRARKSKENARWIGKRVAELAKEQKIEKVVFDRGSYKFHGILAELANSARETGLQF